jgi:SAM-dependent methyltransferase
VSAGPGQVEIDDGGTGWGSGFHVRRGARVDASAYFDYIGRWSQLFLPGLLAAAGVDDDDRVLDVATGPGEAAAAVLERVGAAGRVVGVDISKAMLECALERLRGERFAPVLADGQTLPFASEVFDAVVCQLGLMFLRDPLAGLTECRRTLRVGGRIAVGVIAEPHRAPMWGILADALSRHLPDQSATLHLSFGLSDAKRLERLLVEADFADVEVGRETRSSRIDSFDEYWAPVEAGAAGQLPQAYGSLPPAAQHAVRTEVWNRLAPFHSDGHYTMSLDVLIGAGARHRSTR